MIALRPLSAPQVSLERMAELERVAAAAHEEQLAKGAAIAEAAMEREAKEAAAAAELAAELATMRAAKEARERRESEKRADRVRRAQLAKADRARAASEDFDCELSADNVRSGPASSPTPPAASPPVASLPRSASRSACASAADWLSRQEQVAIDSSEAEARADQLADYRDAFDAAAIAGARAGATAAEEAPSTRGSRSKLRRAASMVVRPARLFRTSSSPSAGSKQMKLARGASGPAGAMSGQHAVDWL